MPLQTLNKSLRSAAKHVIKLITDEIEAQGHRASGNLINSLEEEIFVDINKGEFGFRIFANDYFVFLNNRTPANRIPYNRGSGAKTSKFIEGLMEWAGYIKPALSEKERKSFVFAVASNMKKEGSSTSGAYAHSKNGLRKEVSKNALKGKDDEIENLVNFVAYLEVLTDKGLKLAQAA